jgi:phage terminase large subunit
MLKETKLPPGCGADLNEPLLHNPYQQAFQDARRQRFCLNCRTIGSMDINSVFICRRCQTRHFSNLTAPRLFDRLLVLAGRGGGKTLIGAHAAREEMMVPDSIGWVMGPTYKILHDSTFPTLVRRIPPAWVQRWDPEHMEIRLTNGALVAFRSLEDPERARGPHGVSWGWFDEAAQSPERAYDVFEPTLIKAGGIVIATTTVLGYDWTYDKIEKRAQVYKEPGYWATRYWTEENPLFRTSPVMARQIERARKTMSPEFFAQEYRAERRNASGLIYSYEQIEKQTLLDAEAVKKFIPEWPNIDPSRPILIGLDSGADHPFGAVLVVVTPKGLVVVKDYLKRNQALSQHLPSVTMDFGTSRFVDVKWAANKNEANLRLEWGLKGVGIIPAENKHEIGIQRVQSWLHSGQLYFAYTATATIEQMRAYRYADNLKSDGQKRVKEDVFKLKDELPDALRYALMAWPALPDADRPAMTPQEEQRWNALDDRSRADIERLREFNKRNTDQDLQPEESGFPIGSFFSPLSQSW